jgi:hypothetical protein
MILLKSKGCNVFPVRFVKVKTVLYKYYELWIVYELFYTIDIYFLLTFLAFRSHLIKL